MPYDKLLEQPSQLGHRNYNGDQIYHLLNFGNYTPRQKFSIFQLHSDYVTNPAD